MVNISDGKIGTREFLAIVFMMIAIKATDTTPDLLIFPGKNAAWILSLIAAFTLIIPLFVLFSLMKKHNLGFFELLTALTGKWIGSLIGLILFILAFFKVILDGRSSVDIINTMYYPKTSVPFLLLLLMFVGCFFIAKRGFEVLGRTSRVFFWYINFMAMLMIFLIWKHVDWLHLFPIVGPGLKPLFIHGFSNTSIFGDVFMLAFMFPYLRSFKEFRLASWLGFGISVFWVTFFTLLYTIIFDYPAVEYINYPFHQLTRMSTIGTNTHLEGLFLGPWIISTVLYFAISLYVTVFLFAKILRMNEFEPLLLPFTGIVVMAGVLIADNIATLNQFRILLIQITSGLFVILPFLLWFIDRGKEWAKSWKPSKN